MDDLGRHYLDSVRRSLAKERRLAEGALEQLGDPDFFREIAPGGNSAAVLVKHLAGNFRSRWTDFLTTDGEKPDRRRDEEFVVRESRADLMRAWADGWAIFDGALERLEPADLLRGVSIRGEPHSVLGAIERGHAHAAHHCGQIVLLAKAWRGDAWRSLSIPRADPDA